MEGQPATAAAASTSARPRPEVLAPAGDFDCIRAAVENGADAVYFGVTRFNARARAKNFPLEELPDLLSYLRLRGVKGYVTFNTLVFSTELDDARSTLERILSAGPDALILQDLGIARLVRSMSPDVPLHASTQTTTSSAEHCEVLRQLGFSRVILARELSVADIRRIKAGTDLPLEVFIHGALCVAWSGQCLTSEAIGGRSANRGACAQACRLPYELFVDDVHRDLGDRKYLISPQDLAGIEVVPDLLDLVCSLKIEGRLKSPEYVAATVRAYRSLVDRASGRLDRAERLGLEQVFSRGFSHGFLSGINHQSLVPARSPKKRGILLGHVQSVHGARARLRLGGPLKPGDGVVFDYGRPEEDEPGGRVVHLWKDGRRVEAADAPDLVEIEVRGCPEPRFGWKVWKTDDPALNRRLRGTFERLGARVPVDAIVEQAGDALRVTLSDGLRRVTAAAGPLQPARTRPLTPEYLREQLGRLGGTPFELRDLRVSLASVMLPVRQINELRRRLVADLEIARRAHPGWRVEPGPVSPPRTSARTEPDPVRLLPWCRTRDQLEAALDEGSTEVHCEFEDLRLYAAAVEAARARGARIALAPPRVVKPGETGFLKTVLHARPDALHVRSLAHLRFFRNEAPSIALLGDFSLNVANEWCAAWLLEQGLSRFVPAYDLNWEQLAALLGRVDAGRAEVVIHQHMPMFHMEHCVFAALLSTGRDCTDCGRPCDRHALDLQDWSGRRHPVKADAGCRNTIFNAVAQSASPYVRRLLDLGVRSFRVELLREDRAATRRLLRGYRDVLEGRNDGRTLWQELRASNELGVTRGPLGRDD